MLQHIWPHARAGLIAFHIFAIGALAIPAPQGGMNRRAWSNPTVQAEFSAWAARLTAAGRPTTTEELEAFLWDFAVAYMGQRKKILEPMYPYYKWSGTHQPWRMFIAPHRNPSKLHIDLKVDGDWQPLYIARDPELDWRADLLDNERFRSALFRYAWRQYKGSYRQFGRWAAHEAAAEFPEATHIRLRWYQYRTIEPARIRAGEEQVGTFESPLTFTLDEYRGEQP